MLKAHMNVFGKYTEVLFISFPFGNVKRRNKDFSRAGNNVIITGNLPVREPVVISIYPHLRRFHTSQVALLIISRLATVTLASSDCENCNTG